MNTSWEEALEIARTLIDRYFSDWRDGKDVAQYYTEDADFSFCGERMKGQAKIFKYFSHPNMQNMDFLLSSYETQPVPGTDLFVMVVAAGTCHDPTSLGGLFIREFHSVFYVAVQEDSAAIKAHKFDLSRIK